MNEPTATSLGVSRESRQAPEGSVEQVAVHFQPVAYGAPSWQRRFQLLFHAALTLQSETQPEQLRQVALMLDGSFARIRSQQSEFPEAIVRRYLNELWHSEFVPALMFSDTLQLLSSVPDNHEAFSASFAHMCPTASAEEVEDNWRMLHSLYSACIKHFASQPTPVDFTAPFLRELHHDVMNEVDERCGNYRKEEACPAGYILSYLNPNKIKRCLELLLAELDLALTIVRREPDGFVKLLN